MSYGRDIPVEQHPQQMLPPAPIRPVLPRQQVLCAAWQRPEAFWQAVSPFSPLPIPSSAYRN
jgi:hypothetical protein